MNVQSPSETFIIVVLGSEGSFRTSQESSDNFANEVPNFENYYLFSSAIVITRLAKLHGVPKDQILIFAHGQPKNFNYQSLFGTQKMFYQPNFDKIYSTEIEIDELDFKFFSESNLEELNYTINFKLTNYFDRYKKEPRVLVFFDAHGKSPIFGSVPFFNFVNIFSNSQISSLLMLFDSRYGDSMITLLRFYSEICRIAKENHFSGSLSILMCFANLGQCLFPMQNFDAFAIYMEEFEKKYAQLFTKKDDSKDNIDEAIEQKFNIMIAILINFYSQFETMFSDFSSQEIKNYTLNELPSFVRKTIKYKYLRY